jgi:hypothetical protein
MVGAALPHRRRVRSMAASSARRMRSQRDIPQLCEGPLRGPTQKRLNNDVARRSSAAFPPVSRGRFLAAKIGANPCRGSARSGSPARTRRGRWAAGLSPGQAPSDRERERLSRPGCLIPCHPVSPPGCTGPRRAACLATAFTTASETQRPSPLPGKGPDLRKLVAGAGFEPATSGL